MPPFLLGMTSSLGSPEAPSDQGGGCWACALSSLLCLRLWVPVAPHRRWCSGNVLWREPLPLSPGRTWGLSPRVEDKLCWKELGFRS